jgi:hypothetical protein
MARTAGQIADDLITRVYAEGGMAHTQASVVDILSRCQRSVNTFTRGSVVAGATFTTKPYKQVYSMRELGFQGYNLATDILEVTESNRRLFHAPSLAALDADDLDWFGATGTRFEAWAQVGRDIFIITPAKTTASSVRIYHTLYPLELVSTYSLEVLARDAETIEDLAEVVLLMEDRQLVAAREKLKKFGIGGK